MNTPLLPCLAIHSCVTPPSRSGPLSWKRTHRSCVWCRFAAAVFLLSLLLGPFRSFAQTTATYGPPKIADHGQLRAFYTTDVWSQAVYDGAGNEVTPATYADYYDSSYATAIVQGGQAYSQAGGVWTALGQYDSGNQRFTDANGQPLSGLAAIGENNRFLDPQPGVTVVTESSVGLPQLIHWNDDPGTTMLRWPDQWFQNGDGSAQWVSRFTGVATGTIQFTGSMGSPCSPPYQYTNQAQEFTRDRSSGDGWPMTNLLNQEPSTVYVNGQPFGVTSVSRISSPGYYVEQGTYQFSPGTVDTRMAGFDRYISRSDGTVITGDAWASPGSGIQMMGALNPTTFAVSGLQTTGGPSGSITFAAPPGTPSHGPALIAWGATSVGFQYTAGDGADVYWDAESGKVVAVQVQAAGGVCSVNAWNSSYLWASLWTGTYNPATGAFSTESPLLAIASDGSLLGTPPGVVAFLGLDPVTFGGVSLQSADGSTPSPAYTWRTPMNTWGVKFTNVPSRPFVVNASMQGVSNVQRWDDSFGVDWNAGTSMGGWTPSNIHPALIYVNGILFAKDGANDSMDPDLSDTYASGGVIYRSSDGNRQVTLDWSVTPTITGWAGSWSYLDNSIGQDSVETGTWDGGHVFSIGATLVISLTPAPTSARYGPGQIAWNGIVLVFNPVASLMAGGDDVYTYTDGSGHVISARVGAGGATTLTNTATGESAYGSYNTGTRRFDFGPSFTGVVQALNEGQQLAGDLFLAGSLDIHGSTLNFATDAGNLNKPAFAWLHRTGPIVSGAPSGNHLRWLTATPLYEWTWEAPSSAGGLYPAVPLMALRSHPFPTLAVAVPITSPSGQVVIGPYNNTDPHPASGTVRTSGVLVIGAGTKAGATITRRNAMRVTEDGVVLIQESGDIPMGEFSAGPRP